VSTTATPPPDSTARHTVTAVPPQHPLRLPLRALTGPALTTLSATAAPSAPAELSEN
jgi:hypothetical protein